MKTSTFLFFVLLAGTLSSCKKSTTAPPSIAGTWTMSNVSGTYASKSSPANELITTTYSFSGSVLKESDTTSYTLVTVNTETWTFNNDGTVSIVENYQANNAARPVIDTIDGWWDYTSNTTPNSDVVLRTIVTPSILPIGGSFVIQSVTNDQLIITANEYNSSSVGSTTDRNLTVTFTR